MLSPGLVLLRLCLFTFGPRAWTAQKKTFRAQKALFRAPKPKKARGLENVVGAACFDARFSVEELFVTATRNIKT